MACNQRLVVEVVTIQVPSVVSISEDCSSSAGCCTSPFVPSAVCNDGELDFLDDVDICDAGWTTDATIGLGDSIDIQDIKYQTLRLPAGSKIISTDCYTLECDDTIDLDCECS